MRKNQKKGTKQFEKKVKKLIYLLILLYVGQVVVKGMFSERTVTFYNTAQAEEAETIELPNPCALEVVECAGERMSETSHDGVSLASGNKGQLSPQKLNADGTGAKTEKEEANISRMVNASSIETLIRDYFPENFTKAKKVFHCESGLNPKKHSAVDVMRDGRAFSVGLAQINLTVSNVGGLDCTKAFNGRNSSAVVTDEKLYAQCVKAAEDVHINLSVAQKKFEGRGNFQAWQWCDNKTK
jgi:hypothetical protein